MDAFDCIATKLDVREFITKDVSFGVRKEILEAARLTATGMNSQHWHEPIIADFPRTVVTWELEEIENDKTRLSTMMTTMDHML